MSKQIPDGKITIEMREEILGLLRDEIGLHDYEKFKNYLERLEKIESEVRHECHVLEHGIQVVMPDWYKDETRAKGYLMTFLRTMEKLVS